MIMLTVEAYVEFCFNVETVRRTSSRIIQRSRFGVT